MFWWPWKGNLRLSAKLRADHCSGNEAAASSSRLLVKPDPTRRLAGMEGFSVGMGSMKMDEMKIYIYFANTSNYLLWEMAPVDNPEVSRQVLRLLS